MDMFSSFFQDISQEKVIQALLGLSIFFIAGSIHEFGHAFSAYVLGDDTAKDAGRMTINPLAHINIIGTVLFPLLAMLKGYPLFGWMKPVPVNPTRFKDSSKGQAITAFAGPFSNFLQAALGVVILKLMVMFGYSIPFATFGKILSVGDFVFYYMWRYIFINLILMVFNLLPFPPLDGGWILRHFLSDNMKAAYDQMLRYGFLILYLLLFAGFLDYIFMPARYISTSVVNNLHTTNIFILAIPLVAGLALLSWLLKGYRENVKRKKKFVKKQAHAHKAHEALLKEKNADSVKKQAILDKLKEGTALSAGERSF
ncbi:MAG: site-2 protease family protein, partial [bacterium]|nr:site-2 protease family protein [bacterium]